MAAIPLSLVVLRSGDLDRAERFYGALGIGFGRERHGSGPEHLTCQVGSVLLEIYPDVDDRRGDATQVRLGFDVSSVAEAVAGVSLVGGTVITPPRESPWGLRAVVADPDGHRVELVQRTREVRVP